MNDEVIRKGTIQQQSWKKIEKIEKKKHQQKNITLAIKPI